MTPRRLSIPAHVVADVLAHARAALPGEACGFLAGDARRGSAAAFHPARNVAGTTIGFDVHPDDLARIVPGIEDAGHDLVAIVHSHPRTAAVPSAKDLREAAYPVVQVIASLAASTTAAERLRAWWYRGESATEIPISIG